MAQKITDQTAMGIARHGCGRCASRWGGLNTAHCGACHQTFTGIHAFDRHRTGSHSGGTRHCQPPAIVGLIDAGREYPCWGFPTGTNPWAVAG